MSDARGAWFADLHKRSETEIADLAPYVSQSAVDAVRDAFRGIVLENQEHSEVMDELLPQLKEEPSMRSQSLDWLDVELSHLSDDAIIEFVGRLKLKRGQGLQLDRETAASEPEGARPPVEPATAPRGRQPRWMLPATIAASIPIFLILGIGWVDASLSYRTEHAAHSAFRADFDSVTAEVQKLQTIATRIAWTQDIFKGGLDDPQEQLNHLDVWFNALLERVEALAVQCESVGH